MTARNDALPLPLKRYQTSGLLTLRALVLPVALALSTGTASAQRSAFQGADGQTSVYLSSPAATLNFATTSVSIAYTNRHIARTVFFGYEAFAQTSRSVTTRFGPQTKAPEVGGTFVIGSNDPFHLSFNNKIVDDWLLFDSGYSRSSFHTAPVATPTTNSPQRFNRYHLIVAYNALLTENFLVGVSTGAERRNNLDDLRTVAFETTLHPAAEPSKTTTLVTTQNGFLGDYGEYLSTPIYTDFIVKLPRDLKVPGIDGELAFDLFTRTDARRFSRDAGTGIGLFLSKKDALTKVLGGVSAFRKHGRVTLALVVGFNLK